MRRCGFITTSSPIHPNPHPGAGLGILRKFDFDIAVIDEASQITEPCALIPLVKGVKKGIMVGDQ
jgi:regulator of nonsense transcripts 1